MGNRLTKSTRVCDYPHVYSQQAHKPEDLEESHVDVSWVHRLQGLERDAPS
jgi:hypothetical protein